MNLSISSYIKKIKEIAKSLSASGQIVIEEDLLQYVLDGLGPGYDATIVNLTSRIKSNINYMTLQDSQFLLQNYEIRLEKFNSIE